MSNHEEVTAMNGKFRMGMAVAGTNGVLGTIEDVLYDHDGNARYLVVRDRGVFGSDAVLPVEGAELSGDQVRYPMARDALRTADRYDPAIYGSSAGLFSGAAAQYDQQEQ
jgi:hypothetical protein